jgi:hypothetical protein
MCIITDNDSTHYSLVDSWNAFLNRRLRGQHLFTLSNSRPVHSCATHPVRGDRDRADDRIAAYPAGKFCAWWLPITTYKLPRFLGGASWSLNPGPFNIKEHAIIVMMANVSIGPAYAMYATVVGELYYNKKFGTG